MFEKLTDFSHRHIANVVYRQLIINDLDPTEWFEMVNGFVVQAAEQIKPSSKHLNDAMDLN